MQIAHTSPHLASPPPARSAPPIAGALGGSLERRAQLTLAGALTAGTATQALFWNAPVGLNWWLWDVMMIGIHVAIFRRGKMTAAAWGAIAASVVLGASVVGFASEWTLWVAIPTNAAVLAALPIILRDELTIAELSRLPAQWVGSLRETPASVKETVLLPNEALASGAGGTTKSLVKGTLLGLPTAGLFALLLSADAGFSRALAWIESRAQELVLFVVWSIVTAAAYVVVKTMHLRSRREADGGPTPARGPYRVTEILAPPEGRARVTPAAWGAVIGQVALVFAGFAAVNAKTLFGGHALVRAAGGPTYARYLHSGFGQLLVATVLSVCLVLLGHAWMRPRTEGAAIEPVPGGPALAALETALLVLTGVALASCWQRLAIYEDAYGATYLRLGVGFIELAVLGTLVLTIAKSVKRSWRGHAGAVMAMLVGVAVTAATMNADATITERNLDRAARGRPLDTAYLELLSADACAALDHPTLAADSELRQGLVAAWTAADEPHGWRSARGIIRCGR